MGTRLLAILGICALVACAPAAPQPTAERPGSTTRSSPQLDAAPSLQKTLSVTPAELFGQDIPQYVREALRSDSKVTFDVRMPAGYNPSRPAALLVFIPARPRAKLPADWRDVLDSRQVIFVAARSSGNTVSNGKRISYALMARVLAEQHWTLNPNRIYVSGFSGGGRVASLLTAQFPKSFHGAIYFSGVNFIDEAPELYQALRHHRFVFIAGEFDFNLEGTERSRAQYEAAGITHTRLLVVPRMEHDLPPASVLDEALAYLYLGG
ncbi:MAG: hypothetical protein EP340_00130 [Alphaproteobacteria bacterium]|nr:MAG: hypothetical protein EP340_00130 [Alphaproteobacteria bacterium]